MQFSFAKFWSSITKHGEECHSSYMHLFPKHGVLRKQVHVIDDQTFAKENSWISWGTSYILDGFRYKRKATLVWNSESWHLNWYSCGVLHIY